MGVFPQPCSLAAIAPSRGTPTRRLRAGTTASPLAVHLESNRADQPGCTAHRRRTALGNFRPAHRISQRSTPPPRSHRVGAPALGDALLSHHTRGACPGRLAAPLRSPRQGWWARRASALPPGAQDEPWDQEGGHGQCHRLPSLIRATRTAPDRGESVPEESSRF